MSPESWAKTAIDVETRTARGRRIFFMRAENTCQKFQVLPMRFLHRVPKGKKVWSLCWRELGKRTSHEAAKPRRKEAKSWTAKSLEGESDWVSVRAPFVSLRLRERFPACRKSVPIFEICGCLRPSSQVDANLIDTPSAPCDAFIHAKNSDFIS